MTTATKKLTVREALTRVKDLGISWTSDQWFDEAVYPSSACILGACALACANGDLLSLMDTEREFQYYAKDPEKFRSECEGFLDSCLTAEMVSPSSIPEDVRQRMEVDYYTFDYWATNKLEVDHLTPKGQIVFRDWLADRWQESVADDNAYLVEKVLGSDAMKALEDIPGWNDRSLQDALYAWYRDNKFSGKVEEDSHSEEVERSSEEFEVWLWEDDSDGEVWDAIIDIIKDSHPDWLDVVLACDDPCPDKETN